MSYLSVVRIGPIHDNVSATILKNAILDFFHNQQQAASSSSGTDNEDKTLSSQTGGRFQVSNRYFRANLLFQHTERHVNDEILKQQNEDFLRKEDGIILVFDAARSNPDLPMSLAASFDSLDAVHEKAVQGDEPAGDLLRLCVGVSMEPLDAMELRGKAHEEEYSRRIVWCLDRGYEYVEANLTQEGLQQGHDERDKEGFARIIEAVEGTVWSSAVMSKKKSQQLKQTYQRGIQDQTREENDENLYVPPDPSLLSNPLNPIGKGEEAAPATCTSTTKELSEDDRVEKAREALLKEEEKEGGSMQEPQQTKDEQEHEKVFIHLEGALKQATNLREMAQSGQLSDEQRRQRAGDAAILLMNLMGGMESDDDDDDDNNSMVDPSD